MSPRPQFDAFLRARADGYESAFNRWSTSHAAAWIAYLGARLGLSPNQMTVMSLVCGVSAFLSSFVLLVGSPVLSIAVVLVLAELTFVLDCADGLLARVTGRATPFGSLIDRTLDIASQSCALAAAFIFIYRAGLSAGDVGIANAALVIGFLFLVARSTRHMAIHLSEDLFRHARATVRSRDTIYRPLLTNLLEYQASMIAVLAYLLSPMASLALFALQTLMCAAAVARRLARAANLERTEPVA